MPECSCPSCKAFFSAPSSAFGEIYRCVSCGSEFKLDTVHLARYTLPRIIRIQLQNADGTPFTRFAVPVMVAHGYHLPPLLSNRRGQVEITQEMFWKAEQDEASTGIMDHRGDYSLNRFVSIRILGKDQASEASKAHVNSLWHILPFEKELYGNLHSLAAVYIPEEDLIPVAKIVDLSKASQVVNLEITVSRP